jgi:hypothetical protein
MSYPDGSAVEIAYLKAEAAGLELGGGGNEFDSDYATKGLYYSTSGTYKGQAFFERHGRHRRGGERRGLGSQVPLLHPR